MKKKLLVFASTFPRWKNDTLPPFVYELSKRLTEEFDVSVLAPSFPGAKDFEVMDKMKVYRFHYFIKRYEKLAGSGGILPTLKKNPLFFFQVPFFLLGEYLALKRAVQEIKPDVIHAHWIIPQGWIASKIKKKFDVPYVVTSHGSDIMGLKGFLGIKKETLENAKRITVVSDSIKKEIIKNIDSSLKNKIEIIPMGIDIKLFNPNKKDLSIKKKYNINGPFLLFVGRLAPEKGIDLLINAMPQVIKNNPKTKLLIIGDGTLKNNLKEQVKNLGIEKNIIFIGWVDNKDLPRYYATADLFVCPSLREGSPVSYVEALACGTNILVGDIPISRELIKKFGGNITKHNSEDITKQIILSLRSKKKIKNVNDYDWTNVKSKFEGVLR
ncbi:glycosyltransferase [Candidatus Pacearchaeota archaeon]|nr:glycosyltransferase [Candidatus Pacearchaeota archaeon]